MVFAGCPIRHDDKLWFFYTGYDQTHCGRTCELWKKPFSTPRVQRKGVAQLRPDGYVSVEAASYAPGILTSHRFRQESGGTLRVNVDAAAGGLRYELLEDTGQPVPGCSAADCDPIRSDTLDAQLSWKGRRGWPALSAERQGRWPDLPREEFYVKLRFYIYPGARLYSVTVDPPEVTKYKASVKVRIDD